MKLKRWLSLFIAVITLAVCVIPVLADDTESTVESVTAQLQNIDTLAQMQNKRDTFKASGHYDKTTTAQQYIDSHVAAQTGYKTYLTNMFAARLAAQQAYDSLTPEEQAQIDPALVAKLDNNLPNKILEGSYSVTPRDDEYKYEVVGGPLGFGYEVSTHMVAREIPQTFMLVDTSNGESEWEPNGLYVLGESNYEVAYCCDYHTPLEWGSDYRRLNLEDSTFFSEESAKRIRAIVLNSYPYVTLDEMKANLKSEGFAEEFVDSLTRGEIISAVQMAIWHYTSFDALNADESYFATVSITKNTGVYFTPYHDYTNEIWEWLPVKKVRTFETDSEYKINNLIWYLCNLDPVEAEDDSVVISNVEVGRTDIVPGSNDLYDVYLHILLNEGASEEDDVALKIVSYSTDSEGNVSVTDSMAIKIDEANEYGFSIEAREGDTIEITVEGKQHVERGVYFYESEAGPQVSQALVSIGEGETPVYASAEFIFEDEIEAGLRIYKKSSVDKSPISDITFDVYKVDGEVDLDQTPTESELAKYATTDNHVGSVVTDESGYAALPLDEGIYLIVEQHNKEKVIKPADPFYISIPMPVEKEIVGETGIETVIEFTNIVSVYPKNTPITPPPPPPPPPPEKVNGRFCITKFDSDDETKLLSGAEFMVYVAAKEGDENVETLECNGVKIAVVPLIIDGEPLVLTTDEEGNAYSPELNIGVYYVREIKAPDGYLLRNELTSVNVITKEIQEFEYVRIANTHLSELPDTGGIGTTPFVIVGCLLMAASAHSA